MSSSPIVEKEVFKIYDKWLHSYLNGDIETYSLYLDDQYHFIGSTGNEEFLDKKATTNFFEATAEQLAGKTEIRNSKRTLEIFGDLIFITELLDAYFLSGTEWKFYGRFRFTSVMRDRSEGWRFIYQHFSMPDSKAQEGETIGYDQISEENLKLREAISRRTVELEQKSRELEIEAALERVRSRSMAMQQSEELAEVIQVVYDEFVGLNIPVDHAGFILDYKERDDMHIWLADHQQGVPSEITIPYFDSPHWNSFLEAKSKGKNFFANLLDFEEKNQFYKRLIPLIPPMPEEAVQTIYEKPGLVISTILLENVGLYIENYSTAPFTEEENKTLMRFGKVFQQTYTRFLDLKIAEAQARESQIQAALERVRARSMGMQKSNELIGVVREIGKGIHELGIQIHYSQIFTDYTHDPKTGINIWVDVAGLNYLEKFHIPYVDHLITQRFYNPLNEGLNFFGNQFSKSEKDSYFKLLFERSDLSRIPEKRKELILKAPGWTRFTVILADSSLNFGRYNLEKFTEEEKEIFQRFGKVFGQAYTRFLDLQKAEAQAREAKIEAALEKVRARTMGMQKSDELAEVAVELFEQISLLTSIPSRFNVAIVNENDRVFDVWLTDVKGCILKELFVMDVEKSEVIAELFNAWKNKKKYLIQHLTGKHLDKWVKYANEDVGVPFDKSAIQEDRYINSILFKQGFIGITTDQIPDDSVLEILERFTHVFEQTYTRFLDLQKSEEQAQEAQLELSLERIRAQVTAMQESTDLFDVVVSMRKEFLELGHEADYFWHMRWLSESYEMSMTSEDGSRIGMAITLPKFVHDEISGLAEWEKGNDPYYVLPLDEEGAWSYLENMDTHGDYQLADSNAPEKEDIEEIGGLTFIIARTTHGEIGYSLPGMVPEPPEDALDTLVRFASVFDLAYKRFEDLKSAERQARMIKEERDRLEEALTELRATQTQLIQQEKLASLGQLTAGIAHEIQNPLNFVNNFSELNQELVEEASEELSKGDVEETAAILKDLGENSEKITHHGKRADAIVKGMLAHSRSGKGEKVPTDLNALAEEYLKLSYHGLRAKDKSFNADFKTDFDPNLPKVNVVPQDIGRVLLNLINNAFQACAERSRSAVHEKSQEEGSDYKPEVNITTKLAASGQQLIAISDNGPGIPDDIKDKIFQPFFTTKPTGQGTGLGLSLSYDIVKAHGGTLEVDSQENEGTTFSISLPIKTKN